jgi:hypothetical protein
LGPGPALFETVASSTAALWYWGFSIVESYKRNG